MALPVILFNSGTGSDTAASGAGPATALSGANAALATSTAVTLSVDAPDLSGVAVDGSAAMWVDSSSGRQFSRITAIDNGTKVVTVATAYAVTEGTRPWGIGGKRASFDTADSRRLFTNDMENGWVVKTETDQNLNTSGLASVAGVSFTVMGDSVATKRVISQSANTFNFSGGNGGSIRLENVALENTNGTKTAADGITFGFTTTLVAVNCRFGHATNTLRSGLRRTAGSPVYILTDCEVLNCTDMGVHGRANITLVGCNVHDNANHGVFCDSTGIISVTGNSIIESNGGDGIHCGSTATVIGFVTGNVIHGNTLDGIDADDALACLATAIIHSNNITANGNYGIRAIADAKAAFLDYNNFGTGALANTSGSMLNLTAGANDLAVDPGYADAANGNFAAGTAIKAEGFPDASRKIGGNPTNGTVGFVDVGIQREEAGAAAATKFVIGS